MRTSAGGFGRSKRAVILPLAAAAALWSSVAAAQLYGEGWDPPPRPHQWPCGTAEDNAKIKALWDAWVAAHAASKAAVAARDAVWVELEAAHTKRNGLVTDYNSLASRLENARQQLTAARERGAPESVIQGYLNTFNQLLKDYLAKKKEFDAADAQVTRLQAAYKAATARAAAAAAAAGPARGAYYKWSDFVKTKPCPPPKPAINLLEDLPSYKMEPISAPSGFDLAVNYSYTFAPEEAASHLNGINASLFFNLTPNIAVGGDFSVSFGSRSFSDGGDLSLQRSMFLFGPQYAVYLDRDTRSKVFLHALAGVAVDSSRLSFADSSSTFSASALALAFGGGVDVQISRSVAVRAIQLDYIPTRFGESWQSNWRAMTGVVMQFGYPADSPFAQRP